MLKKKKKSLSAWCQPERSWLWLSRSQLLALDSLIPTNSHSTKVSIAPGVLFEVGQEPAIWELASPFSVGELPPGWAVHLIWTPRHGFPYLHCLYNRRTFYLKRVLKFLLLPGRGGAAMSQWEEPSRVTWGLFKPSLKRAEKKENIFKTQVKCLVGPYCPFSDIITQNCFVLECLLTWNCFL